MWYCCVLISQIIFPNSLWYCDEIRLLNHCHVGYLFHLPISYFTWFFIKLALTARTLGENNNYFMIWQKTSLCIWCKLHIKTAIKDFPSKLFQIRSRAQFPLASIKMPDEIFFSTPNAAAVVLECVA